MSLITNLDLIRRIPLFSMLTIEQARLLAAGAAKRRLRRGARILEQGRKSGELIILLSGRARVTTSGTRGREVILAKVHPGEYVGEMSLIDDEPNSVTVRCEMQSDVLIIDRAEFTRCLPEDSSLGYAIMRGLVNRTRDAHRRIESLAFMDVSGRVAHTLLDMSQDIDGERVITSKVSRLDLAKFVGASRKMVGRVMKDLETRGLIGWRNDGSLRMMAPLQE